MFGIKDENCYFCPETECLQDHHIVPKEYNGSDSEDNLVTVCPTCHRKLHKLYNNRFYKKLGVDSDTSEEKQSDSESNEQNPNDLVSTNTKLTNYPDYIVSFDPTETGETSIQFEKSLRFVIERLYELDTYYLRKHSESSVILAINRRYFPDPLEGIPLINIDYQLWCSVSDVVLKHVAKYCREYDEEEIEKVDYTVISGKSPRIILNNSPDQTCSDYIIDNISANELM